MPIRGARSGVDGVLANKNGGAPVGVARPELSFIEGANITLTVADDAVNNEIDVTIAATGAEATEQDIFYPAPNPDDYKGRYATMLLADNQVNLVRQTFYLPNNWTTDWGVSALVIPDADGNLNWGVTTNFGQVCSGEYDDHSDSIGLGTTAVQTDDIECLDITAALTNAAANDLVGIEFTRDAESASDTVGDEVHYVGILLTIPVEE